MALQQASEMAARNSFLEKHWEDNAKAPKDKTMGKDAFLTMMIAQLKNQDPMNPLEGTQFTSQLAQFSALEQALTTNTNLSSILDAVSGKTEEKDLFDYIGKEVKSDGNPLTLKKGEVIGGFYTTEEAADVSVVLYDTNGNKVKQLYPENVSSGTHLISWDGTNDEGLQMPDGNYTYKAVGKDSKGKYVNVGTSIQGVVDSIEFKGGSSFLNIGGKSIDPDNVIEITLPETENNEDSSA